MIMRGSSKDLDKLKGKKILWFKVTETINKDNTISLDSWVAGIKEEEPTCQK